VEREAPPADHPTDAAAEGQTADADAPGVARCEGEVVRREGVRDGAPGRSAADPYGAGALVEYFDVGERGEIDDEAASIRARTRGAVTARADGDFETLCGGEAHGRGHLGGRCRPCHENG